MCARVQVDPAHPWVRRYIQDGDQRQHGKKPVFPMQPIEVLRLRPQGGQKELVNTNWGLIAHWAKEAKIGRHCYNARSETIFEKPSFRDAVRLRRAVVPVTGFFEWIEDAQGKKQLLFLEPENEGAILLMAGLWEFNAALNVTSSTIVTTQPNPQIAEVHDRMPVILDEAQAEAWLDPGLRDPKAIAAFFKPWGGRLKLGPASA